MSTPILHFQPSRTRLFPNLLTLMVLIVFTPSVHSQIRPSDRKVPPKKLKFTKHGGVVYKKAETYQLKCDVYVPEGKGPFPAIIAIHGGGWFWGSKLMMLRHAWKMAQSGYVVVAINYRHAPEYRFPAQIYDCKHAVRWTRWKAPKYKINPKKIGVFGYSAGGHLAALLGTTQPADGFDDQTEPQLKKFSSAISAVAAGGAPCEFSWIGENSMTLHYFIGGTRKRRPKAFARASPITYVTKHDVPFYFFHGSRDATVPIASPKMMNQALLAKGVESKLDVVPKSGHISTFSNMDSLEKSIRFFNRHFN